MQTAVAGLFDERFAAERAVKALLESGFVSDDISIVSQDRQEPHAEVRYTSGTKAGTGMAAGATAGGVIGGLFGLLVGATVIAIPGTALLVAGPLMGFLTGALAGAATGGLLGSLIGLGIPRSYAEIYAEGVRRGGVLVIAHAHPAQVASAETILRDCGAVNIQERAEEYRAGGWTGYDPSAETPAGPEVELATMEPYFRSDYNSRFGGSSDYEAYAPAYRWGYQMSQSPVYASTEWETAAPTLQDSWEKSHPGTWATHEGAIRYAWDRARVKTVAGPELI